MADHRLRPRDSPAKRELGAPVSRREFQIEDDISRIARRLVAEKLEKRAV